MLTEAELDDHLSRPTEADTAAQSQLDGDLLITGVSGKMGPSLARLARRASEVAGVTRRIIGVARFSDPGVRDRLERDGITTVQCDLLDRASVDRLPDAPNVIHMAGQKFGTIGDQPGTWAANVLTAALIAQRFSTSRIVAFSTGNVYPLAPVASAGPTEADPVAPIGEYAQSALGRERVLEYFSLRDGTPMAILRLNYAVELRYGVLRDLADRVMARQAIDLTMSCVNLIWQRDANSIALRCFAHCSSPPLVLNVTGPEISTVKSLTERLAERLGIEPIFRGGESATALLSNATRCRSLFGDPGTTLDQMIAWTADWVSAGGASLGKPTHFEERDGRF
jgi:nucleoside-diphosphate-sugar epimerase